MFQKDTIKTTWKIENLNRLLIKLGIFKFLTKKAEAQTASLVIHKKKKKKNCKHQFVTLSQKAKKRNIFQHILQDKYYQNQIHHQKT